MAKYFDERCNKTSNVRDFWKTIGPFMSDNNSMSGSNINLYENDEIISNQEEVANIFNDYFINITKNLSEPDHVLNMNIDELLDHYADHSSVKCIENFVSQQPTTPFSFTAVTNDQVISKLKSLKCNKAQGYDQLPTKLMKIGADVIGPHLCKIINCSILHSQYPDDLKHAEVVPLFKKQDKLNKSNFRPVSILVCLSKIVEGIMCDQLMMFFDNILCNELSAYRKLYGCQNVLLQCIEQWKLALDQGATVGCIMMDLSKAFDSIPHGLLVSKLSAYGVSKRSCNFIKCYLSGRKQRVKLAASKSRWLCLERGVPQGSLTGPVLFNIFLNDLLLLLKEKCQIYNYADDNSLAFFHNDPQVVKSRLENASESALQWFNQNFMEANPSKFQAIVLSKTNSDIEFNIDGNAIKPMKCVKLLGVHLDDQLSFSSHVNELYVKCSRQISAMGRLSKALDVKCKQKILDAFVLSNFNYCNAIYHFCSTRDSRKIEKLLGRALRYVYIDFESNYNELLKKSKKSSLYVNRMKELLLSVYKVRHGLMPPIDSTFFLNC